MKSLQGKIAVVAGATRGAGRGIACMLGEAGATVYCTGRSTRARLAARQKGTDSPFGLEGRPEIIEETAEIKAGRRNSQVPQTLAPPPSSRVLLYINLGIIAVLLGVIVWKFLRRRRGIEANSSTGERSDGSSMSASDDAGARGVG